MENRILSTVDKERNKKESLENKGTHIYEPSFWE